MTLNVGARVGSYEILDKLGVGGMGEVYRARDTKLGRDVAIKVLPEAFSKDRERLDRFEREARLLAQLNHTNIATIYGLEELDGQRLLVMELVEGETLADRIARGPIPIDEAIPLFTQIAEGLEAAHNKGIIHRDLKPANVMITPDGHVKLLDFGLAKAFHDETGLGDDASQSPTMARGTALGVILGTASYMSPEQARGKAVDKRTDLWAFGCCLYEALVGRKAFFGETTTDTLAAIVNAEADWDKLPEATPTSMRRLLHRCLTKKVRERLTDAGMARIELKEPPTSADTGPVVPSRAWQRPSVLLPAAIVLAAVAAALAWSLREPPVPEVRRVSITAPPGYSIDVSNYSRDIDISPDGQWIAYVASTEDGARQLYLRAIHDFAPQPIVTGSSSPLNPRFTPDSDWLGYFDADEGRIMRVPIDGGRPETVCEAGRQWRGRVAFLDLSFDWDGRGGVVFTLPNAGLRQCDFGSGEPKRFTAVNRDRGENAHNTPHTLPDGSAVLFSTGSPTGGRQLAVLGRGDSEPRPLKVEGTSPRYLSTGHIIYAVEGGLRAIAFDISRLDVVGESFPVLDGVLTKGTTADFAIADDGTLIYVHGDFVFDQFGSRPLVWVDREGRTEPIAAQSMGYTRLQISPSGTRVALEARAAAADVWVWDIDRETLTRVTFEPVVDGVPIWISDERLLFESHRSPQGNVFEKAADGTGTAEQVVESPNHQTPLSVSPDGKWFVFEERIEDTGNLDLTLFSRETGIAEPLLATEFQETSATISPDGGFIAYHSNESGQTEVYVRPFPNIDDGKWPISSTGGFHPVWSRDGRELFFLDAERRLSVVDVRTADGFSTSRPKRILEQSFRVFGQRGLAYDVSTDGKRFLTFGEEDEVTLAPTEIHVVLNWFEEFKRLAAASH